MLDVAAIFPEKLRGSLLVPGAPDAGSEARKALPTGLAEIDNVLPDGGLPRGAVVELASPRGLARTTSLALLTCASAQAEARLRGSATTAGAWCAWIDPSSSLHAPGVLRAGVDLGRLLVVRPPAEAVARAAVRVATSHAFAVVVVDLAGVPGTRAVAPAERLDRWATSVRRLALAAEGSDTTIVLLTDAHAPRSMPLPVAMRVELDRTAEDRVVVRVAKERRGRVGAQASVTWPAAVRRVAPSRASTSIARIA